MDEISLIIGLPERGAASRMPLHHVRAAILRGVALSYLAAFGSLYLQIPGLFGDDGLLPVGAVQQTPRSLAGHVAILHERLGLCAAEWLEVEALSGVVLATLAALGVGTVPVFALLWLLYASCYQVGQSFLAFQWDALLLEVGVQAVLLAPILKPPSRSTAPIPMAVILGLRFTLFKLMLMSGAVKVQSACATWQNLSALRYHFATQCLPTPLAYHAHHLPPLLLKVGVAATFVIELPATLLLLLPCRPARALGAALQLSLQLAIALTGNYNFFNLLTGTLCLALLDDDLLPPFCASPPGPPRGVCRRWRLAWRRVEVPLVLAASVAYLGLAMHTMVEASYADASVRGGLLALLALPMRPTDLRLRLSSDALQWYLERGLPVLCHAVLPALFAFHVAVDVLRCLRAGATPNPSAAGESAVEMLGGVSGRRGDAHQHQTPPSPDGAEARAGPHLDALSSPSVATKQQQQHASPVAASPPPLTRKRSSAVLKSGTQAAWLIFVSMCACLLYAGSAPHLAQICAPLGSLGTVQDSAHAISRRWQLSSGYGLFRRMTGVGKAKGSVGGQPPPVARPEVVVEVSLDAKAWWPVRAPAPETHGRTAPKANARSLDRC